MADLLDMAYINSLPHPLFADLGAGSIWPMHDICVQTGLVCIDVCGLLQVEHFGGVMRFRDADGKKHSTDDFYLDSDCWDERHLLGQTVETTTKDTQ